MFRRDRRNAHDFWQHRRVEQTSEVDWTRQTDARTLRSTPRLHVGEIGERGAVSVGTLAALPLWAKRRLRCAVIGGEAFVQPSVWGKGARVKLQRGLLPNSTPCLAVPCACSIAHCQREFQPLSGAVTLQYPGRSTVPDPAPPPHSTNGCYIHGCLKDVANGKPRIPPTLIPSSLSVWRLALAATLCRSLLHFWEPSLPPTLVFKSISSRGVCSKVIPFIPHPLLLESQPAL